MIRNIAKYLRPANIAFALVVWGTSAAAANDMMVMDPVARPSHLAEAKTGAVYFSIMNHGAKADKLIGVKTPVAEVAEFHESSQQDGVFRMRPMDEIALPAGATVDLTKELHVMLFGLNKPLKKDDGFQMTLDFETAPDLVVNVVVGDVVHLEHAHTGN
jgi:periplasmic copper chaperone A